VAFEKPGFQVVTCRYYRVSRTMEIIMPFENGIVTGCHGFPVD
jgi:hypothetical protein